ncbi:tetratricopeptide repeat protein [bacterium]|nr:tetratricopeptide repeat protein [bacterium]
MKKEKIESYEIAVELFKKGKFTEAIKIFEKSLETKSDYRFWFKIGRCYEALGKHDEAILAYKKSNSIAENGKVLFFLAKLYAKIGEIGMARTLYEEILKIQPTYAGAKAGKKVCDVYLSGEKIDEEENLILKITREKYCTDFAHSLSISLNMMANADHKLLESEIEYIHMRLKYFKRFLPVRSVRLIEKEYTLSTLEEYTRNIPLNGRLFLFQLVSELASVDNYLASEEYIFLIKLHKVLEIDYSMAQTIIEKTKPVNWKVLEHDIQNYRNTGEENDLELFLYNWERYWNSYWDDSPPELRHLTESFQKIISCVHTTDEHSIKKSKICINKDNIAEVNKIRDEFISGKNPILNKSLSFIGVEKKIHSHIPNIKSAVLLKFIDVIFINRIYQAFEHFFEMYHSLCCNMDITLEDHDILIKKTVEILKLKNLFK